MKYQIDLNRNHYVYSKKINHPIHSISKAEVLLKEFLKVSHTIPSVYNVLEKEISVYGGYYQNGGDRSEVSEIFSTKYMGGATGENLDSSSPYIKKLDEIILKNSKHHKYWSAKILKYFLPNIKSYLKSSKMEPKIFQALFMIGKLNIDPAPITYYTKFKFYAFKPEKGSFTEWILNKDTVHGDISIDDSFLETFHKYLLADGIYQYVYDTSSGMEHTSKILDYIKNEARGDEQINHIVPIVNLWDPGSAKVENYNKNKSELLATNSYMDTPNKDNLPEWFPKRDTLSDVYTVSSNSDTNYPISLSFKGTLKPPILMDTGLSVLDLSIILRKLVDNKIPLQILSDSEADEYNLDTKKNKVKSSHIWFRRIPGKQWGRYSTSNKDCFRYEKNWRLGTS